MLELDKSPALKTEIDELKDFPIFEGFIKRIFINNHLLEVI